MPNTGKVVQIIGPVVDCEFDENSLPTIYNCVIIEGEAAGNPIRVSTEVQQHLGENRVRCVSMQPTEGMVRGMKAIDTGQPISVPVGRETLGRVLNVIGEPVDELGELKAKKFDNGKKVFDFSDELWEMIAEEALTGEPQQYPAMAEPGKLERARNAAKQYVNNPNAYPGAITAVAAGLIDNPTGPLPTKEEKKAWERGEWTGSGGGEMKNGIWVPAMASGGTITGSGSIIGHAGEEVSPASAVVGAKSTLERMSEAAEGGQGGSITVGGTTININVDRMDSDIDLERALAKAGDEFDRQLMFRLRNLLDSGSLRGIGYLRG